MDGSDREVVLDRLWSPRAIDVSLKRNYLTPSSKRHIFNFDIVKEEAYLWGNLRRGQYTNIRLKICLKSRLIRQPTLQNNGACLEELFQSKPK